MGSRGSSSNLIESKRRKTKVEINSDLSSNQSHSVAGNVAESDDISKSISLSEESDKEREKHDKEEEL